MERLPGFVTGRASDGLMRIHELVIREIMVEAVPIQLHNVRVAALVFGMAVLALLCERLWLSAMVALVGVTVFQDILVASDAKRGLSATGEGLMTFVAFFFDLGVAFRQRAGGHEALEQTLRDRRTRGPDEEESCKQQKKTTRSRHAFSFSQYL